MGGEERDDPRVPSALGAPLKRQTQYTYVTKLSFIRFSVSIGAL